ncbi:MULTISPECIES: 50S ribosomal protein L24 [Methylophaga]|jgi:large subunit ribosomal protein L24|uniref:Large ribosomal subunit protein uL24 n=1 Tax=Methylophaga muralis TaxID=291169 RepID=A0A1E3GP12_9GAMM|nr:MULTISPECIES: 50S ribosomal protein L24 [Methylophaga]MAK66870.1 50S ribosomal protein L24 [Methylophaga sp.]MAY17791.1 50S ribosomal protein L24 [Methylophaga sp.]MCB2425649.1 50S ribosomal protein L24 [Methylophaga pinxianii]MDO8827501.1 50S ribosomal protein L24 [Methylophaga sp.]ODN65675.1 50S ribosomal protein L24 [Methylophaga muralis]|tara:strand:+ start:5411 stop:5728 length:318 start_codon:yes stop_codon:yes gene_type:complete
MERLVKGDQVVVTVGKDRGKQGEILRRVEGGKFVVQGINLVKKHTKPNPALGRTGGIVEKEMPIHGSNLALLNPASGKGDKVGFKFLEDGRKVRVFKSNGETVGA